MDEFEDENGCPETDNDKDGILDQFDACPNEFGPDHPNGCPLKYAFIEVTDEKITLKQAIFFKPGKSALLVKNHPLLDEVASVLRSRASVHVRIDGHTDGRGNRSQNLRLSQSRAESVLLYLTGRGIGGDRMEARGYGPDRPIDSNSTTTGRERNRRVEFLITKQ
jgi:outer membrane protein OmpA-like peptidoglycan-associated protein